MASGRLPSTSALAAAWCNRLDQFCTQLQRSCTSLHAIAQRKPEPESRGDNFDSFLEDLNDDVSSALAKLQQLEERTRDTLSFEELLVHCDALYKSNEDGINKLELQLQQYGYMPVEMPKEVLAEPTHQEIESESQNSDVAISPPRSRANFSSTNDCEASVVTPVAHSYDTRNTKREAEYSPLFGDLGDLSLESLGISATSLTALAGQDEPGEGSGSIHPLQQKLAFAESPAKEEAKMNLRDAEMEDNLKTKYGSHWKSEADQSKHPPLPSVPVAKYGSTYGNDEKHLGPVLKNSEAEIKHPLLPASVTIAKYGSTSGNDERHPGPVVFNEPVSEYGNEDTSSIAAPIVSKKDVTVQSLETKKVAFLTEVTSAQYDSSPIYIKRMVSIQELNGAVTKINELLRQRTMGGQHANQFILDQDDIQALGLGSKTNPCILILKKADKLAPQNTNGVTTYRAQEVYFTEGIPSIFTNGSSCMRDQWIKLHTRLADFSISSTLSHMAANFL